MAYNNLVYGKNPLCKVENFHISLIYYPSLFFKLLIGKSLMITPKAHHKKGGKIP